MTQRNLTIYSYNLYDKLVNDLETFKRNAKQYNLQKMYPTANKNVFLTECLSEIFRRIDFVKHFINEDAATKDVLNKLEQQLWFPGNDEECKDAPLKPKYLLGKVARCKNSILVAYTNELDIIKHQLVVMIKGANKWREVSVGNDALFKVSKGLQVFEFHLPIERAIKRFRALDETGVAHKFIEWRKYVLTFNNLRRVQRLKMLDRVRKISFSHNAVILFEMFGVLIGIGIIEFAIELVFNRWIRFTKVVTL